MGKQDVDQRLRSLSIGLLIGCLERIKRSEQAQTRIALRIGQQTDDKRCEAKYPFSSHRKSSPNRDYNSKSIDIVKIMSDMSTATVAPLGSRCPGLEDRHPSTKANASQSLSEPCRNAQAQRLIDERPSNVRRSERGDWRLLA